MRIAVLCGVFVLGTVVAPPVAAQNASAPARDRAAIRELVTKLVDVINGPKFSAATRDEKIKMLEPFYRPDVRPNALGLDPERGFEGNELPLFFGPAPDPVLSGTKAHLLNTVLSFATLFQFKYTYRLTVEQMQVFVDVKLGTATLLTSSTVTAPDGVSQTYRGRSTVVFLKMPDDSWVIGHEHIDLINPRVAPAPGADRPGNDVTEEEIA